MTANRILRFSAEYLVATHHAMRPIGLVAGSIIWTADGELPVEYLTPGDRIVTRAHGMVQLEYVSPLTCDAHMIRIDAGALSDTQQRPTILTAAQPVLLRGNRALNICGTLQGVVPAGALVDDIGIHDLGTRNARLVQLAFARPEIIYSDEIEVAVPPVAGNTANAA